MSDYVYGNEFLTISGEIDGSDFHSHFTEISAALAARGKIDAQAWTGAHTMEDLSVSGDLDNDGGTW